MASAPANLAADSVRPLEVDALVKSFGAIKAVSGVSLELLGGECLGLLGPNGAGKSTVIRAIVGRVIPDAGRISVFGSAAGSAEARAALGWIPQDLAVYPRLTCKENLLSFGPITDCRAASSPSPLPGVSTGLHSRIVRANSRKISPAV